MEERTYVDGVEKCRAKLYRVAYSILLNDQDSADAIQEAVLKGWGARWRLRDPQKLEHWLMRILVNECRNVQRVRGPRTRPIEDAADASAPVADMELRDAIRALPEKYRALVLLHYAEGYSQREIARALHLSEQLVKSRLRQARGALKRLLGEVEE